MTIAVFTTQACQVPHLKQGLIYGAQAEEPARLFLTGGTIMVKITGPIGHMINRQTSFIGLPPTWNA